MKSTTNDTVAAVMADIFRSVEERDNALFDSVTDEAVELHWPPELPYGGVARGRNPGRPGWGTTWNPLQPTAADRRLDPRLVATTDEEAVVLWHQRGVAADGRRIDTPVLGLYRVIKGKLVRGQMFYFDPRAVLEFLAGS